MEHVPPLVTGQAGPDQRNAHRDGVRVVRLTSGTRGDCQWTVYQLSPPVWIYGKGGGHIQDLKAHAIRAYYTIPGEVRIQRANGTAGLPLKAGGRDTARGFYAGGTAYLHTLTLFRVR